jgi:hypothetical protein
MSASRAGAPPSLAAPLLRLLATFPTAGEMAYQVYLIHGDDPELESVMSPEPVDIANGLFDGMTDTAGIALDNAVAALLADTVPGGALDPATLGSDVVWALAVFRSLDAPEQAHQIAAAWIRRLDHLGREDHVAHPVVAATAAYVMAVTESARGRWPRAQHWAREGATLVEHEGVPGLGEAVVIRVLRLAEMAVGGVNPELPLPCPSPYPPYQV